MSSHSQTIDASAFPQSDAMRALFGIHRVSLGYLFVLIVPIGAAVSMFFNSGLGGFNVSGWMWVLYLFAGGFLVCIELVFAPKIRIALPLRPWIVWYGYVWLSLLWCGSLDSRNVQDALQITMPLLVGVASALFVQSEEQLKWLFRMFTVTLLILCVHTGLSIGGDEVPGARVFSMTAALIGCVALAEQPDRFVRPLVIWSLCIFLTFLTGSRTATAALLLVPMMNPRSRGVLWRMAALSCMLVLGVALFHTSTFQERFFHSGSGTLSDAVQGGFLSFGRFEAWPFILEEAWKTPVFGHGVGSTFFFVPRVWESMTQVHNDYLRVGFELGLVGLGLFVAVLLWQMWHLRRQVSATSGRVSRAFAASLMGLIVFAIFATTDNVLVYNLWYTNPLFALIGAAYGVAGHHKPAGSSETSPAAISNNLPEGADR